MKIQTAAPMAGMRCEEPRESRSMWTLAGRMTLYSASLGIAGAGVFGLGALLFVLSTWFYTAFNAPTAEVQALFQVLWGVAMLLGFPFCGGLLGSVTGALVAYHSPPTEAVSPLVSPFFRCVWRNVWGWTLGATFLCVALAAIGATVMGNAMWALLPFGALGGHIGGAWRGLSLARQGCADPAPVLPEIVV